MPQGRSHIFVTWTLFFGITGGYLLMAKFFPLAYIVATYEDLVGEWGQVFLFLTTMILSLRLAWTKSTHRWFFTLLALACFYVVGEEISWGQRIFDIQTPEFFKTHNQQNETNLHNFFTGPIKSWSKMLLEYLLAIGLLGYGLLYPLLVRMRVRIALWLTRKGLPFPPLYLWPFFACSAFFELGFLRFNEAEIAEILIPLALAIMALNYLQAERLNLNLQDISSWDQQSSKRLARQTAATAIAVLLLAVTTTTACYSSPRLGPEIEKRYLNGVEKFAGRYQRLENWSFAAELYALVYQQEPQRAEILRELHKCYSELGEPEKAQAFLKQSEQLELDYLARKPLSVAAHLSLAETYRLMGKEDLSQDHLRGSLEIAKSVVKKKPKHASAIYWLGRAQEKNGNQPAALQAYQHASELRPDLLSYRKAVLRIIQQDEDE